MEPHSIHVLVVDDEPAICVLSREFLELSDDMEVETACSASEARNILGQRHFDVIVCDYQMPNENGLQFLRSLRIRGDHTFFILFTGKGRDEIAIETLDKSTSYLQKGGRPEPLYTELDRRIHEAVSISED